MRTSVRGAKVARLTVEVLEDRLAPALAYALTSTGAIATFDTAAPATLLGLGGAVTGVTAGETLVGIDVRPATGQLYALGVSAATGNGSIYTISVGVGTATATLVGTAGSVDATANLPDPTVVTSGYGVDFNPTVDRIRIVTTAGQSIAVNPDTGAVTAQAPTINGPVATVDAAGYTNNFPGATTTTLNVLDAGTDTLYTQNPTTSTLTTVGALGVNFDVVNGFDISPDGTARAILTVGGTTALYTVNLTTGAATAVGNVGAGAVAARGFAVATGGAVSFQSTAIAGNEGTAGVNVVLTRTGFTGPQTVTVNVTGGTATPTTDFTPGPYTVSFANGATTATLNIVFASDGLAENPETLNLTIATASNGTIGTPNTTTLTVSDPISQFNQSFGTGSGVPGVAAIATGSTAINVTLPYGSTAAGGVRVATGDVNGDGVLDLVTVPTAGSPLVKVFSGIDGSQLASFLAYPASVNIPASVAVGDLNNDGFDDIVIGTNTTLAAILVFDGRTLVQTGVFLAFGSLPVGVNVAVGDTDGDGQLDIIAGTATGLAVIGYYDGQTFAQKQVFLPFGTFMGGVTVAAGDFNGDNKDEVVVGTASQIPAVAVFSGVSQQKIFLPFGGGLTSGVNVAANDVNGDGVPDIIAGLVTGLAVTGAFDANTLALITNQLPFGGFVGGIFVA